MLVTKTWEQSGLFDPTNPDQRIREVYAYPGDGGSFTSIYWNPVKNAADLNGLRGLGDFNSWWAGIPDWVQMLLVGGAAATAGYFGMKRYGDKYVRPALAKVGIGKK